MKHSTHNTPYRIKEDIYVGLLYIPPYNVKMDEYDEHIQRILLGVRTPWYETKKCLFAYLAIIIITILMVRVFSS